MDNMNKMKIRLNATADVREFVRAAEKCDFDVDIQYDSTIVDAKSILGIISLGLAKILTVIRSSVKIAYFPSFLYTPLF